MKNKHLITGLASCVSLIESGDLVTSLVKPHLGGNGL